MRWWCVCLLAAGLAAGARAANLFDLMSDDPDLSEFLDLVKTDVLVSAIAQQAESTVFAPTNAAMRRYSGERSTNLLLYHVVNLALSKDQMTSEGAVPTRLKGNQPVFVSTLRSGHVFINNARILSSDIRAASVSQQDQVLHVIDEVLEPTIPAVARHSMHFNPRAIDLLAKADQYDLGGASIEKFYQTVQAEEKLGAYNSTSFHTYFIPVDEKYDAVRDRVTDQVIDGHVIPGHALFTRTMGDDSYHTLAFNDVLKVTIRLRDEELPVATNSSAVAEAADQEAPENLQQARRLYEAQSTIVQGTIDLPAGSVLAKVVKPNIAVRNGVVHLISKPLMVTDGDVFLAIQEGQDDRFHGFFKLVQAYDNDFMLKLMATNYFTIFIPSNQAFKDIDQRRLDEIIASPKKRQNLLNLHMITHKVTTETVRRSAAQPFSVESAAPGGWLYLSVAGGEGVQQPTLTVEGGGTSATVIVPDIGRSNGVIHIIDRFLGVPYQTVAERVADGPLASVTSSLARDSGFMQQLKASDNVTLLLPADIAWQRLKAQLNTSYKAVFANRKSPEVLAVLTRHLVVGRALTIAQMAEVSAKEGGIATTTDQVVKVEHIPGSDEYLVKWQSLQARVTRADEECTNGYIHVIDAVLIGAEDVSAPSPSAALSAAEPAAASALLLAACWALLRL